MTLREAALPLLESRPHPAAPRLLIVRGIQGYPKQNPACQPFRRAHRVGRPPRGKRPRRGQGATRGPSRQSDREGARGTRSYAMLRPYSERRAGQSAGRT